MHLDIFTLTVGTFGKCEIHYLHEDIVIIGDSQVAAKDHTVRLKRCCHQCEAQNNTFGERWNVSQKPNQPSYPPCNRFRFWSLVLNLLLCMYSNSTVFLTTHTHTHNHASWCAADHCALTTCSDSTAVWCLWGKTALSALTKPQS